MNTKDIIITSAVMVFLIVIPGYALARALYPGKKLEAAWIMVLSFLLGLTPPLILYTLSKNFGVPITTETSLITVAFVTCVGAITWWSRRGK